MRQFEAACTAILAWSITAAAVAERPWPQVVPVEGAPLAAKLIRVDANEKAAFQLQSGSEKELELRDICRWGAFAEPGADPQTVLVDGSLISADIVSLDKDRVTLAWGADGEIKLPLELVAGIVFAPPADVQQADLLRANVAGTLRLTSDRVLLSNGDELKGEIGGLVVATDPQKKSTRSQLVIRTSGGETKAPRDKLTAIAFNPSLAAKPKREDSRLWVGFADGSRLLAKTLTLDAKEAKIELALGPAITVPAEDVVALLPLGGRTVYLSDFKPASYQQIPYLNLPWPWHADANVLGSQLRGGGRLHLKGLGMHAAARLTYDLDQPYRTFTAEAAIDDVTAGRGAAVFRVYIDDGSGKWQLKYDSPIVRGGAAPVPIAVDLKGAKRLSLLVDFGDKGDELAHADWLDARLVK
jgi:hypothetical protein